METTKMETTKTMRDVRSFDEASFDREVLASSKPVLVEFGATWCGPCRALAPVVASLAEERAGTLSVGEVDVDASPGLATRFGVRGVPTLIVFADGKERARHVGVTTRAKLGQLIDGLGAAGR